MILAATALVMAILVLVKPKLILTGKNANMPKIKAFGMSILLSIALAIAASCTAPNPADAPLDTSKITAADAVALKDFNGKVNAAVQQCDAVSDGIKVAAADKNPNFNQYFEAAKNAEDKCKTMSAYLYDKTPAFEHAPLEKSSNDLRDAAAIYIASRQEFAAIFKESANAGRVTPENASKIKEIGETTKRRALALVLKQDEFKKLFQTTH